MRILFVNPPQYKVYEKFRYSDYQFPLGLAYIIGAVHEICDVHILDCNNKFLNVSEITTKILEYNPEYVAFTCTTPLFTTVSEISKQIKRYNPKIKIIVGGHHITALYDWLKNKNQFDYLFIGESEDSFRKFVELPDKHEKVIFSNDPNINTIDYPPRHLFYTDELKDYRLGGNFTYMITSRGCVGRCKYCVAGNKKGVRFRTIEDISKELKTVVYKNKITNISFEDDNFLVNKKRIYKLCEELSNWNINYFCMGIAKFITEPILQALKDSGCSWICYGVESGDNEILKDMGRLTTTEETLKAIELTKKVGIKIRASYMLGWINETEKQVRKTLKLIKEIDADENAVSIVTPYPGTELWKRIVPRLNINDVNFERFCYYNKVAWNLSSIPTEKLLELQQEAFAIK